VGFFGFPMLLAIGALLLWLPQSSSAQNSNVGIGTTTPDPSAILDLTATGKGFLVPRMTTSQYNPGISSPAQGLLVYDLSYHTFYYYNGTIWLPFLGWSLTGNSSTNPTVNFLGTTDAEPLIMKTNGVEDLRLTPTGLIGVGITTPSQKFEVSGNVRIDTAGGGASQLQFETPSGSFATSFQAGSQTTNIAYTLPISQGAANTVLTNDGSGLLSWSIPGTNYDWLLTGNSGTVDGTNFLGTTDNVALTFRVNNLQALRIEPNTNSPNIIGGYLPSGATSGNYATSGTYGSFIGGGGTSGTVNSVTTDYDFIGGGIGNTAGDNGGSTSEAKYIVIGGGSGNTATSFCSSVLGGYSQTASGRFSSILGGEGDITYGFSQSVVGQFNDPTPTTPCGCTNNSFTFPAFIVGGGTSSSSRYNSMIVDFRGVLELGEEGSNSTFSATPELKISGSTSGYVGFEAAAATTSHRYVMPATQGAANTVLTNDGSGNLSWGVGPTGVPQRYAVTTLASFSTSQNNLHLDTTKTIFRVTCTPAVNITGFADTSDGRFVILTNYTGKTLTITNQDASSTAAYRVITSSIGSSATLLVDESMSFFYDGETQRWRLLSRTP
jgi:hypothetical protein